MFPPLLFSGSLYRIGIFSLLNIWWISALKPSGAGVSFFFFFFNILMTPIFFFYSYFIYLFILFFIFLTVLGLRFVRGLSLVAASGGHTSSQCGDRSSSRCMGLSLSRPLPLRGTGSRRAGSAVVAHGPSCSAACGIFPDQGSNPCPLH